MWSTTALLVLLSIGVYIATAVPDAKSDVEVQKFLDRVTRSIASKDVAVISGLFQPGFVFNGCKGVYDKQKVVGILSNLPAGTKFTSTLKSSEYVPGSKIRYTVEVTGFGEKPLIAEFFLSQSDQQLIGGSVPACSKTQRFYRDDASAVVEKFLARITRSVESKDVSIISGLFQPGFIFKGCRGTYDKTKIVGLLSKLPAGTKFSFTLISAVDQGSSIKYQVSATGFGPEAIVAEFVLNKNDQQLESGSVPACQKTQRFYRDDVNAIVEKFLARITRSVQSKDVSIISGLFQPGFVFKGCKGTYDKTKIVGILSNLPAGAKFDMKLKSATDLGSSIRYLVAASGFDKNEIIAEFVLNKNDQQLESGSVPACQKSHRFYREDPSVMVEKFLARITRSIESKDTAVIAGLFQPGFVFKGCKGTYNKTKIVGLLSKLPANAKFNFKLNSAVDLGSSIKYEVSASGFAPQAIVAEFVLNKHDQQLESGNVPACQKTQRFYRDDTNEMVNKFLARITRSIDSKDVSIISGLFQPGFIFKGCKGTYDKTKIVGLLSKLPAGAKFSFTLISAVDQGSSIKYQVSATGFGPEAIVAEFVLNKNDQQLESGNVPACQKTQRFYRDDVKAVVEKFLARIIKSIESKDVSTIADLFQNGFKFRDCKGIYDKAKIVGLLSNLPAGHKFSMTLMSVVDQRSSIKYQVTATGFGPEALVAEFVLNKNDQQLERGSDPACMAELSRQLNRDGADHFVQVFMIALKKAIMWRDVVGYTKFLDDQLLVIGCGGTYDKAAVLQAFKGVDTENPFDYELLEAPHFNSQMHVEFSAKVYGIWDDFTADFIYNPNKNTLLFGKYTSCKTPGTPGIPGKN